MEDNEGCHDTSSGKLCLCSHFRPAEPAPESDQTLTGPLNSSEVQPADSGGKTPEQMRVEIAKWCGTDNLFVLKKRGLYYRPNGAGYTGNISEAWILTNPEAEKHVYPHDEPVTMHPAPTPNYPASIDAMATAEATLTDEEWDQYVHQLFWLLKPSMTGDNIAHFGWRSTQLLLQSTALQRARAFLAVKGASK